MAGMNAVLGRNTKEAPQFDDSTQTVAFSHYNHLSAQLPLDPETMEVVSPKIEEQIAQSMQHIKAIVESIDHVMDDIVRLTIHLTNKKYITIAEEKIVEYFKGYKPAVTIIVVKALPKSALVQIEAVVSNGEGTIPNEPQAGDLVKLVNATHTAPSNHYSTQTVAFSHYNNVSAQLPIDPATGRIVSEDIKGQTIQALRNLKAILTSIDVPFDDIVKVNIHVTKLSDGDAVNEVYKTFFPDSAIARAVGYMPARSVIVTEALPMGALVQVEAVVSYGDGTPPQAIEDRHGLILEAVNSEDVPKNEYATHSVAFSHYNNLSGQLPVDATGKLVSEDVAEQAKQILTYFKQILEKIEHSMEDVVKVSVQLKDLKDLEAIEAVYAEFFKENKPARTVYEVSEIANGARIQMDAVVGNTEGTPPIV